jgi:alkyl hydroperoxide reductase subunit AhpC
VHREYTLKSREDGGLGTMQIPMLADIDRTLGKDYGVYLDHSDDAGLSLRGTFIIDRE